MKFEIMDNSCTFVMFHDQGNVVLTDRKVDFSCPLGDYYLYRYKVVSSPMLATFLWLVVSLVGNWEAKQPFLFKSQISSNMTKENEICKGVKYSNTRTRTPRRNEGKLLSEIKELQKQLKQMTRKFEIEKDCKNQAYYWVLSSGNFKRFAEFCKKHPANLDYHGACLAQLYLDSLINKKY